MDNILLPRKQVILFALHDMCYITDKALWGRLEQWQKGLKLNCATKL